MKYTTENNQERHNSDICDEQGDCLPSKYEAIIGLLEEFLGVNESEVALDLGDTTNNKVTIEAQEYFELVKANFELITLYSAGVGSWDGYDKALKDKKYQAFNSLSLDEFIKAHQLEIKE